MAKGISLVFPLYKTESAHVKKVIDALKSQNLEEKIELVIVDKGIDEETMKLIDSFKKLKGFKLKKIKVDEKIGFASSMNTGIKGSTNEIVVILQQDCIPQGTDWLAKLTAPLDDEEVVATVSKVELPFELWNKFDPIAKILSAKEQKIITPLLDEKGCAYRKSALVKTGLFDEKTFKTAGEDFDMAIKLRKFGRIAYPNVKLIHNHCHTQKNRLKKELQLSNAFGALVRIYGRKMPNWHVGFLKSIPILGFPLFMINLPMGKLGIRLSLMSLPVYLLVNLIYGYGFWKGFMQGRQTI